MNVKMPTPGQIKEKIQKDVKKNMDTALSSPLMKSFLAGALSGSISAILLQPLDLLKTRLQSSLYIGSKMGMIKVAIQVIRQEKLIGLWTGLIPSLVRCTPGLGIYFGTLHSLRTRFGSANPHALESLFMGVTARTITGVLMLPVTVIKTRYESGAFRYKGFMSAVKVTYKAEGFRGLYSGLTPTLLRDVPFSGLYLMFYTKLQIVNQPSFLGKGKQPLVDFCNGLMAGVLASFVTQPADVLKTTMQLNPAKHHHMTSVLFYIYQEYGLTGLWRGIVPRTLRRTLMSALAWTVFEDIMRRCNLKS